MKQTLKKSISLFLAMLCMISAISPLSVMAEDSSNYVSQGESDSGNEYYIIEGESVDDLFDFTLKDLSPINIMQWVFNFKTYAVVCKYTDASGTERMKGYFNTPNLQMLAKNIVIKGISDGYPNDTYDVNDTQRFVKVGNEAGKENAITKYGFNIPNKIYAGEYPKQMMSIHHIVPTGFFETIWNGIKMLLGFSFIKAPDVSNYETIEYFNHMYTDPEEYLVSFIQKNFIKHFVNKINNSQFSSKEDFLNYYITDEAVKSSIKGFTNSKVKFSVDTVKSVLGITEFQTSFTDGGEGNGGDSYNIQDGNALANFGGAGYSASELAGADSASGINSFPNLANKFSGTFSGESSGADAMAKLIALKNWWENEKNSISSTNRKETITKEEYTRDKGKKIKVPNTDGDYYVVDKKLKPDVVQKEDGTYDIEAFEYYREYFSYTYSKDKRKLSYIDLLGNEGESASKLISAYQKAAKDLMKFYTFITKMQNGQDNSYMSINYNQCLIENEGEDGECKTFRYNNVETSISMYNLWIYSGVYDICHNKTTLTRDEAVQVIQSIQAYCGPAYTEVMTTLMCVMEECNKNGINAGTESSKLNTNAYIDLRVMPYDVNTLTASDAANFTVEDPRVKTYTNSFIGGLVSTLSPGSIFSMIHFEPSFISLGGRLSELAVFFQQICNFEILDGYGLSPAKLWTNGFVFLVVIGLCILFILKTIKAAFDFAVHGNVSMWKVIGSFIALFVEIGFLFAILANPDGTWNIVKKGANGVFGLGEELSVASNRDVSYLFGDDDDHDMAVTYYIPYLDMWSEYNTGYGLFDTAQQINTNSGKPEVEDITKNGNLPKIGTSNIQQWSVLLADSFSYYGDSNSIYSIPNENERINGGRVNNNAYRVVDHFMAPRISYPSTDTASKISIKTEVNENYNGNFQHGLLNVVPKLMNVLLVCLLSLVKMLTFFWFWFMIYIFVFKVLISRTAEQKSWGQILAETFAPLLAILFIGMYAGLCIQIGSLCTGIVGIVVEIGLYALSVSLFRIWGREKVFFPKTLMPIYMLLDWREYTNRIKLRKMARDAKNEAALHGFQLDEEDLQDSDKDREKLFNEDGSLKYPISGNEEYTHRIEMYEQWVCRVIIRQRSGIMVTDADRAALMQLNAQTGANYDFNTETLNEINSHAHSHAHSGEDRHSSSSKQSSKRDIHEDTSSSEERSDPAAEQRSNDAEQAATRRQSFSNDDKIKNSEGGDK